jgi:phosphatidylglycerophosphatase A
VRQIRDWKDWAIAAFTSVLFVGYAPFFSGTIGSVPGAVVAFCLGDRPLALLLLAFVLFVLGTLASSHGERIFGRKDPREVVIDEFVGMLVAFLWLPVTLQSLAAAFLLFRLFDIWKPFPARKFEDIPGGLGIMADDLVAGIYANLTYRILAFFL